MADRTATGGVGITLGGAIVIAGILIAIFWSVLWGVSRLATDGRRELGALDPGLLERVHLAERSVLHGDVPAHVQRDALERALERELAPVDRGRPREDRCLKLTAGVTHARDSHDSRPGEAREASA